MPEKRRAHIEELGVRSEPPPGADSGRDIVIRCPVCRGSGADRITGPCEACEGIGDVRTDITNLAWWDPRTHPPAEWSGGLE